MSFFLSWLQKKPENKVSDIVTLYINDKKTFPLKREGDITCGDVCKKFASEFSNRNKAPDLRVMLVIESKKDKSLISKRVLSPFEKIFSENFIEEGPKAIYKYYIIDMNDFMVVRNQYITFSRR